MIDSLRPVQPPAVAPERAQSAVATAADPPVETPAFSADTLERPVTAEPMPLHISLPPHSDFQTVVRPTGLEKKYVPPALGLQAAGLHAAGVSPLGIAAGVAAAGAGLYAGDWAARELYPGQEDKRKHALVGGVISGVGGAAVTALTKNRLVGALAGIALGTVAGAAKEIYDKTTGKGTPDVRDFYATALGAVTVGVTLTIPFR